jgi:hypothetical protein
MDCWNSGIMGIKIGKSGSFGSGALRLRITEFILRNEGLRYEAKYFCPSASSPPQADAPQTSIREDLSLNLPFQYFIVPISQLRCSSWGKAPKLLYDQRVVGYSSKCEEIPEVVTDSSNFRFVQRWFDKPFASYSPLSRMKNLPPNMTPKFHP